MNEYEDDHDASLRTRLFNARVRVRNWIKVALCSHRRTHITTQSVHSGKNYETVVSERVTTCTDCGKTISSQVIK